MKILWTIPASGSLTISSYKVEISNKAGTVWSEETVNCNGASALVMANHYCIIPMSLLTITPFFYVFDDLVVVRISAQNSLGYGPTSVANSVGAKIRRIPDQMLVPTIDSSTDTEIIISWTTLLSPSDGNSALLNYELLWDNGSGASPSILLMQSLDTTYTVSGGLTGGTDY